MAEIVSFPFKQKNEDNKKEDNNIIISKKKALPLSAFKAFVESLGGDTKWINNIPQELEIIDRELEALERKRKQLLERKNTIIKFLNLLGIEIPKY